MRALQPAFASGPLGRAGEWPRFMQASATNAQSRLQSHYDASTSSRALLTSAPNACRAGGQRAGPGCLARTKVVSRALFDPPPFSPDKLRVQFAPGTTPLEPSPPQRRRYTLTHNDITGMLSLTIGSDYNHAQISGFYTRLLRDEVIAEWKYSANRGYSLHVYCHVSGEERWLAPPLLRNYIFRREMPLVLDTFLFADSELLTKNPQLVSADVYIHFHSSVQDLNTVERWGQLGDRSTWSRVPTSILLRVLFAVFGWPPNLQPQAADLSMDAPLSSRDDGDDAPTTQSSSSSSAAQRGAAGSAAANTSVKVSSRVTLPDGPGHPKPGVVPAPAAEREQTSALPSTLFPHQHGAGKGPDDLDVDLDYGTPQPQPVVVSNGASRASAGMRDGPALAGSSSRPVVEIGSTRFYSIALKRALPAVVARGVDADRL